MDLKPTNETVSHHEGLLNIHDYNRNRREELAMTSKSINFDSSNDGDHYRNYVTEQEITNSNYIPPRDPLHHNEKDKSVEFSEMNMLKSDRLFDTKKSNNFKLQFSKSSKTSFSEDEMSEYESNIIKSKYCQLKSRHSDRDNSWVSDKRDKPEKMATMKVTFNKRNCKNYASQDRKRKRKRLDLEIDPNKSQEVICKTMAKNSQRDYPEIITSDLNRTNRRWRNYINTVSTNVSQWRKSKKTSSNNASKSRNRNKSHKVRKNITIETSKHQELAKLIPRMCQYQSTNITPMASSSVSYKKNAVFGLPSETEVKMIKQINDLKRRLEKQQNIISKCDLFTGIDKAKEDTKKYK